MIAPTNSGGTRTVTLRYGSSIVLDGAGVGHVLRRVDGEHLAVRLGHAVLDGRRGGQQVEVELALEPLLDDLHVEQAEEAAAEAEARARGSTPARR